MYRPLAEVIRPETLSDVVGQQHILGKNGLLRRIIESGQIPNMVFYGPSGTGKTTVARMIAGQTNRTLHRLNATTATLADIKAIVGDLDTLMAPAGVLLYLDEVQYFNKKQQQSLLEFMENGKITLIASTTENPYFYIYNAVLSRSTVFEFLPVPPEEIKPAVRRAFDLYANELGVTVSLKDEVIDTIAFSCGGDVRKAMNAVEILLNAGGRTPDGTVHIMLEDTEQAAQRSAMRYDRDGDAHYDLLSAFHKSLRGSDPDAAMHYLARALLAGDLPSVCRRMLAMASEDVGLAYPQAVQIVKACVDSALQLGMPEARLPLAQAALLLATAPKSNSVLMAIDRAMSDAEAGKTGDVPRHLKDAHYSGAKKLGRGLTYQYPHNFDNHWIRQQYLPDEMKDVSYYVPGDNKAENQAREYWKKIKGE